VPVAGLEQICGRRLGRFTTVWGFYERHQTR